MSSSCCVIQLLLNYTSIGCAGFSALTPYRTHFRLVTAALLAALFMNGGVNRRSLTTTAVTLALVFSQDALAAYNTGRLPPALQALLGTWAWPPPAAQQQPPPASTRYQLEVAGIRCEACAARIKGVVAAVPGVANTTVNFSKRQVEVWASGSGLDTDHLVAAIGGAGYTAQVTHRDCFDDRHQQQPCTGHLQPAAATQPVDATPHAQQDSLEL
jgi:copper chaperone CopZ